ncbi:dihydrodipicolinate synthase family protein [Petrimonas sp.]|uniref:dihydrodipicolinate synthase family protein n=1 Tax=Petrimonas sp. TaxID=2023866 RepID=UPI002FCB85B3
MKKSFYPALGTPTHLDGTLVKESFSRQIELMIEAGAQGVLCMGSMGNMASLRNSEYPSIAQYAFDVIHHRIPLLVGVMDCSISRVLDRIYALKDLKIDGVVTTVPFYSPLKPNEIVKFFSELAKKSKFPVYIYDLPGVTQSPISLSQLKALTNERNIVGIKTGNLNLIMELYRNNLMTRNDFSVYYSNLDLFDVAIKAGVNKNLDGMFTCTPYNSQKMYAEKNSETEVFESLNNILKLRNLFIKENVLAAYSYAMGLLKCPGNYHADYVSPISRELKEEIADLMKNINEI